MNTGTANADSDSEGVQAIKSVASLMNTDSYRSDDSMESVGYNNKTQAKTHGSRRHGGACVKRYTGDKNKDR